ncbi:MAG: hypothetical protein WEA58_11280 [Balneolaceae bacterium]
MGTGQTLLVLAAIVLFMITSLNVNRSYLNAVEATVDQQEMVNSINFGQSVIERIYSQSRDEVALMNLFGDLTDVENPDSRLEHESETGETLAATVEFSEETEMKHGINGRVVSVDVYQLENDDYVEMAAYSFALISEP